MNKLVLPTDRDLRVREAIQVCRWRLGLLEARDPCIPAPTTSTLAVPRLVAVGLLAQHRVLRRLAPIGLHPLLCDREPHPEPP